MTDPAPGVRDPIDDHGPMSLGQEPADIAAPPSDAPSNESASTGQLIRSSSIVGAGTLLSRLTGMLRYVAIAVVLGGRTLADGYNLANTTPNMIYDLLLGGVFSATLIPVFVDNRERNDSESTDAVVTVLVTALIFVTVIGVVLAPWIFRLYTWDSPPAQRRAQIAIGVPLLRWFLPQILFYGLTAIASAMLNARRRYAAPAFAPVLNNIVVLCIIGAFWRVGGTAPSAYRVLHDRTLFLLLAAGTTAGIVVMAASLWPALRHVGVRLHWRFDHRNRSVRRVFALSGWTFGYALVNQIALVIVLALALRHNGGVTSYTYAFMVFQLPYGLFVVSLMTTVEPELAHAATRADADGFRHHFAVGLRLLLLAMIPSAVGLALLAHPIATFLFDHGAYRRYSTLTGDVLQWFAVGLVGFAVYLFALRVFYSLKDTRTPFLANLIENGVNVALAFALVGHFRTQGLAAAYSAAYAVAAVAALLLVKRRILHFEGARNTSTVLRVVAASAVMGLAVYATLQLVGTRQGFAAVVPIVACVAVGVVVFVAVASLLRVEELTQLVARLRARRTRQA